MYNSVLLGIDDETQKEVWLSGDARKLSTYVIGTQGAGKSNLLVQVALQDIDNGDGICFITPHPDIDEILKRIPKGREEDVIVFAPHHDLPIGLNVFEGADLNNLASVSAIADDVVMGTFKLHWGDSWGPQMEELLYHITLTILYCQDLPLEKRPTLAEFSEVIELDKEPKYRNYLLSHIEKQLGEYVLRVPIEALLKFWREFGQKRLGEQEVVARSTLNKARLWRTRPIIAHVVGQYANKLDLTSIMEKGKILLVDLDEEQVGKGSIDLLGSLFAGQLYLAALRRPANPTKQFHIIADEFGYYASKAFAELQDRTRKRGVDVLVAHQRRDQLTDETRSSTITARNRIVFAINDYDAKELAGGFSSEPAKPEVVGEKEPLGYAPYPWDALKQQANDNKDITKLVHAINSLLAVGEREWDIRHFLEEVKPNEVEPLVSREVNAGEDIGLGVYAFPDEAARESFVKELNRVLYLMMTGAELETVKPLLLAHVDRLFGLRPEYEYMTTTWIPYREIITPKDLEHLVRVHNIARENLDEEEAQASWESMMNKKVAVSSVHRIPPLAGWVECEFDNEISLVLGIGGKTAMEFIIRKMAEKEPEPPDIQTMKYRSGLASQRQRLMVAGARLNARIRFLFWVDRLGQLLAQYPVKVRGGQPEPQYDRPRAFADVTNEWVNRLTQLDKYVAWARIQEGHSLKTYKIIPEKLSNAPPDGAERAKQIREASAEHYGMSRKAVDQRMRERVVVSEPESRARDVPDSDPVE